MTAPVILGVVDLLERRRPCGDRDVDRSDQRLLGNVDDPVLELGHGLLSETHVLGDHDAAALHPARRGGHGDHDTVALQGGPRG